MTDKMASQSASETLLEQMLQLQFAWQQLFWRMPLSVFSNAWLLRRPAPATVETRPATDQHGQLVVPPTGPVEGDHALFA